MFQKGQSGNPGGRKAVPEAFRKRCLDLLNDKVIDAWEEEIENRGKEWMRASELVAGYAIGKPAQAITGADGGPLDITSLTNKRLEEIAKGDK